MVIGITFQQHFLTIELHAELRTEFNRADAKLFTGLVSHRTILSQQLCLDLI